MIFSLFFLASVLKIVVQYTVIAKERKEELEQLFYPINISTQESEIRSYNQENLAMRRGNKYDADDIGNTYTNNDNDDLELSAYDQLVLTRKKENKTVADYIGKRVKLLCWIMTCPDNHVAKAMYVKETWGSRCDVLLFMSSVEDLLLPTVKLPVMEGRDYLHLKQHLAMQYIYDNYLQEAEWFLKADDDTYVIVENLKYLLYDYNSNDELFFGSRIRYENDPSKSYFDGGAGYVLSREALKTLITKGSHSNLCKVTLNPKEDVKLANCLKDLGVIFMDTRDKYNRHRFFVSQPHRHITVKEMDEIDWFVNRTYHPFLEGRECCSEHSVSFHHVNGTMMYILEYFVYHLRLYGIRYEYQQMYN